MFPRETVEEDQTEEVEPVVRRQVQKEEAEEQTMCLSNASSIPSPYSRRIYSPKTVLGLGNPPASTADH
jgi:hypothetical protein